MAAKPIPTPQDEVDIDANGNVTGLVEIKNSGVVKFNVKGYKPGTNVCIVKITNQNISWAKSPAKTENTIKVGNG